MGVKQCEKCCEMVDEAKAFCPACGNAFVEEEHRSIPTNFEEMDSTVQLGQTMYNQMLSDMGLNISKSPEPVEKSVEIIRPEPAAPAPTAPRPAPAPPKPALPSWVKWVVLAAGIVLIFALAIIAIAIAIFWFSRPSG
ncbi:MAG: hypothetical protein AB7J13_00045 [Pyrinomonadaceae bacterium]